MKDFVALNSGSVQASSSSPEKPCATCEWRGECDHLIPDEEWATCVRELRAELGNLPLFALVSFAHALALYRMTRRDEEGGQ